MGSRKPARHPTSVLRFGDTSIESCACNRQQRSCLSGMDRGLVPLGMIFSNGKLEGIHMHNDMGVGVVEQQVLVHLPPCNFLPLRGERTRREACCFWRCPHWKCKCKQSVGCRAAAVELLCSLSTALTFKAPDPVWSQQRFCQG